MWKVCQTLLGSICHQRSCLCQQCSSHCTPVGSCLLNLSSVWCETKVYKACLEKNSGKGMYISGQIGLRFISRPGKNLKRRQIHCMKCILGWCPLVFHYKIGRIYGSMVKAPNCLAFSKVAPGRAAQYQCPRHPLIEHPCISVTVHLLLPWVLQMIRVTSVPLRFPPVFGLGTNTSLHMFSVSKNLWQVFIFNMTSKNMRANKLRHVARHRILDHILEMTLANLSKSFKTVCLEWKTLISYKHLQILWCRRDLFQLPLGGTRKWRLRTAAAMGTCSLAKRDIFSVSSGISSNLGQKKGEMMWSGAWKS